MQFFRYFAWQQAQIKNGVIGYLIVADARNVRWWYVGVFIVDVVVVQNILDVIEPLH